MPAESNTALLAKTLSGNLAFLASNVLLPDYNFYRQINHKLGIKEVSLFRVFLVSECGKMRSRKTANSDKEINHKMQACFFLP